MMRKRLVAGFSALILCVGLAGCSGETVSQPVERSESALAQLEQTAMAVGEEAADAYQLICENGKLRFFFNASNASFYLEEKATGLQWHSNPPARMEDSYAAGIYRMEMSSLFIVHYINKQSLEDSRFNTYTGSVMTGEFTVKKAQNGLRLEFTFPDYDVMIPLELVLNEEGFSACIPLTEVESANEELVLSDISLLPYFGAGGPEDEGYVLVPDGSGGLIHFHNGRSGGSAYSRPVYGSEATDQLAAENLNLEGTEVKMPVFGIRKGTGAFLAVSEQGQELATLEAFVNGQNTSYAGAYFTYKLKSQMAYQMGVSAATIYEKNDVFVPELQNQYFLLDAADADYSGMARRYRQYLIEEEGFETRSAGEAALFADIYAGVSKTVSTLGVRYDTVVPLTKTGEAVEMLEALKKAGIDSVVFRYSNWNKRELDGKLPDSAKMAGGLKSGGAALDDLTQREDVRFYPAIDKLVTFTKGNAPWSQFFDPIGDIAGVAKRIEPYVIGLPDDEVEPYYLLRAGKIEKQLTGAFDRIQKAGLRNLGLSDVGQVLYNDYSTGVVKRPETRRYMEAGLSHAADAFENLLLESPNIYAVKYARDICNAPIISSGQDLIDEDVPFYELVTSGFATLSAPSLNSRKTIQDAFLKTLEAGCMPSYSWIYRDSALLTGTPLDTLIDARYTSWVEEAAQQYAAVKEIGELSEGSALYAHHMVGEDVSLTVYENGAEVYVNYGDQAFTLPNGRIVEAHSHLALRGEPR